MYLPVSVLSCFHSLRNCFLQVSFPECISGDVALLSRGTLTSPALEPGLLDICKGLAERPNGGRLSHV